MNLKIEDGSKVFFTSDPHYYHSNIIKFCNRPFEDVHQMNVQLIENWNKVVPNDGIVFLLGDFAFTQDYNKISDIVYQLNGKIHLIMGNHDYQNKLDRPQFLKLFESISDIVYLQIKNEDLLDSYDKFILCHYPFLYWRPGYINLHGHIHSGPLAKTNEPPIPHLYRYDVGVDNNNYFPISYNDLMVKLTQNYLNSQVIN